MDKQNTPNTQKTAKDPSKTMQQPQKIPPEKTGSTFANPKESNKPVSAKLTDREAEPYEEREIEDEGKVVSQKQALPSVDEIKGKWKQQVGAAKIAWGKLTEDELLKTEGHQEKLAGMVQERYAITRDEAEKQIKKFFESNKH